jgi:iron complex transport system substrate-binding protein
VSSRWVLLLVAVLSAAGCRGKRPPAPAGTRIVSLSPSATEVVAALGATAQLVGVDTYSSFPPEVAGLPRVGTYLAPDVEAIARLRPSVVISDDVHASAAAGLRSLGIPTVPCPMHALPDVRAGLTRVGAAIGRERQAAAAVAAIDAALDASAARRTARLAAGGRRPRVLLVIDRAAGSLDNLVAAGSGSWLDELVAVVGGDNVLAGVGARYPKIGREEVLRAQPDLILDVAYAADPATAAAEWGALAVPATAASAGGRGVVVRKDAFLLGPSPRVAEALAAVEVVIEAASLERPAPAPAR